MALTDVSDQVYALLRPTTKGLIAIVRGMRKRRKNTVCDRSGLSDVKPTCKIGPLISTNETFESGSFHGKCHPSRRVE